jgi:hypothetical protein
MRRREQRVSASRRRPATKGRARPPRYAWETRNLTQELRQDQHGVMPQVRPARKALVCL